MTLWLTIGLLNCYILAGFFPIVYFFHFGKFYDSDNTASAVYV